ncbi:MAG TPA: alpha/beta hydrolase [Acidimicrobiales bacterium]|nr:alpha/beta hydrolase [Acidimicrobiales bacterium]
MTTTATSSDGTAIAFDVIGDGPPVVLVAGIFCTRHTLAPLAAALSDAGLRAATYDRRGRGDSGGGGLAPPPAEAIAREVEDLAAVAGALGGDVAVYGHSSGACVAARATGTQLRVRRLVLHEPPWSDDDPDGSLRLDRTIRAAIDEQRLGDAITAFLGETGMPPEVLAGVAADPAMLAVAPTMPYDLAATGADGSIPADLLATIAVPTLVVAGTASPPFFLRTAEQVTALIPGATLERLEAADHGAPADQVAPAIAPFLTT